MKSKTKLKQIVNSLWFIRLWKHISRDKTLCPICQRNPIDKENPDSSCFNCYFKTLHKTTYRHQKGGEEK